MITIEALNEYGADTQSGLTRCMGMKDFYIRLVRMELNDGNFEKLASALENKNMQEAFEAAHALKGAIGNLALTPIYDPVCELTELLRSAAGPVDTGDLLPRLQDALARLKALDA